MIPIFVDQQLFIDAIKAENHEQIFYLLNHYGKYRLVESNSPVIRKALAMAVVFSKGEDNLRFANQYAELCYRNGTYDELIEMEDKIPRDEKKAGQAWVFLTAAFYQKRKSAKISDALRWART